MQLSKLSFGLFIVCIACNPQDATQIGSDFISDGVLQTVFVDTLTLKVSTVKIDSIPTSNTSRLMMGTYRDKDLGNVEARAYFQIFSSIAENTLDPVHYQYTRASLIMPYDNYSYADTTQEMSFSVFPLTQQIKATSSGFLYNNDTFDHDPSPIGEITFTPKPNRTDSIEIPLTDAFAHPLFDLILNYDPKIRTSAEFFKLLPGLAVIPDTTKSGAILGFKKNMHLRMYYLNTKATPVTENHFDLNIGDNLGFVSIITDRTGTDLDALSASVKSVPSSDSEGKSYTQAGAALGVRVDIPHIKSILTKSPNLVISRAILIINPVRNTTSKNKPLPPKLTVYLVNGNNTIINSDSKTATLNEDVYLGRDTNYTVDVTNFVNMQLGTDEFNNNAIFFTVSSDLFNSTVYRLYVSNQAGKGKMKLNLYYVSVNQNE